MTDRRRSRLLAATLRIYPLLLAIFPRSFRHRFGHELRAAFADRARERLARRGIAGLVRLWLQTLGDLLLEGGRERWQQIAGGPPGPPLSATALPPTGSRAAGRRQGAGSMDTLAQDARYALRTLRDAPGFTAAVVVTVALGVGATTAVFTVVDNILLRPLPFEGSERVVAVCETSEEIGAAFCGASLANSEDWERMSVSLERTGIARGWSFVWSDGAESTGVSGGIATPGWFDVLGLEAEHGRLFTATDMEPGSNRVAILSHSLWSRRYGGDPEVVGRTVQIDDRPFTVIGVLPAGAEVPHLGWVEAWTPLTAVADDVEDRGWIGFWSIARLADGATVARANDELASIHAALAAEYPEANAAYGIRVLPLRDLIAGPVRPRLTVFMGAVVLVLLIACGNVANLLLARATRREQELAVRASLGAGGGRLARQLLTESVLLAGAGGLMGFALATGATRFFVALAPGGIPRLDEVGVDGRIFAFAMLVSAATAVLFGLAPALQAARPGLGRLLRGTRSTAASGQRLRGSLVVVELALALMLLTGAGLMLRGFSSLLSWQPPFEADRIVTAFMYSSDGAFANVELAVAHHERIAREVTALPGVGSTGLASAGPLFGGRETADVSLPGRDLGDGGNPPRARWFDVDEHYLPTLGLRILRGRNFDAGDVAGSTQVAIVNQTMARRFWPDTDPLGETVIVHEHPAQIVGIVEDVEPVNPDAPVEPWILWPKRQLSRWGTNLVIRTAGDPAAIERPVRALIERIDPDLQLARFVPLDETFARNLVSPRFNALLVGLFAAIAVALAAIGTYGLMAYAVAARTAEIGIRMALGAGGGTVTWSVVRSGMKLAALGLAFGLAGATAAGRALSSMLYGLPPTDPLTLAAVVPAFALVTLAACWIPARRAARLDPTIALRSE